MVPGEESNDRKIRAVSVLAERDEGEQHRGVISCECRLKSL